MSRKSSFQSFDDWYAQIQQFRERWDNEKESFKEEWSREKQSWSDEWKQNVAHARSRNRMKGEATKGFLAEIVTAIVDAVDYAKEYKQSKPRIAQRPAIERLREEEFRRREEAYRRIVRKMELTERRLERRKRVTTLMGIFTGIWTLGWVFSDNDLGTIALIFGGITAWQIFNVKELQGKLGKLRGEYEQFTLAANTSAAYYPPGGEKTILRHAYERNGRVYPEMLAIESDFSLAEIEQMLNTCVEKHIADIEIDEKGRRYYYFSSLDNSDPYENLTPPV